MDNNCVYRLHILTDFLPEFSENLFKAVILCKIVIYVIL